MHLLDDNLAIKTYELHYESNQLVYKKITYDEDRLIDECYDLIYEQREHLIMTYDGVMAGCQYF